MPHRRNLGRARLPGKREAAARRLAFGLCWSAAVAVGASEFFVTPTGSPTGHGSRGEPWDLQTALNQPPSVKPGDTIWLRAGIYTSSPTTCDVCFQSRLTGTASAPIIVRQYPGERAILQEPPGYACANAPEILRIWAGGHTWFWGFEIRSTNATRVTAVTGSGPSWSDLPLPSPVSAAVPGIKLINLIIHDTRGGIGLWTLGADNEASGCLIYNNGWSAPDRGHGHGIYCQNQNGQKHISDNIICNQFGVGIHGYTTGSSLRHFLIERNIIFNNGVMASAPGYAGEQILFGGGTRIFDLKLFDNYVYLPLNLNASMIRPDYSAVSNSDVTMANNYFAGGSAGGNYLVTSRLYDSVVFTHNTLLSTNGGLLWLTPKPGYIVNNNTYYGNSGLNFNNDGGQSNYSGWQDATGFDTHSFCLVNTTPPNKVVVNPNTYEPKRAHIAIYNWTGANIVTVDVSRVLNPGDRYEVRNAQDYFAPPVLAGTYTGRPLNLPMTNLTVAIPPGWTGAVPTTGKQFNAFVLIGSTIAAPPPR